LDCPSKCCCLNGSERGTLPQLYNVIFPDQPERAAWDPARYAPDVIVIYQRPIESISRSDEDVKDHVRDTVLHEVGHYFGLGEAELREIERAVRAQRKGEVP